MADATCSVVESGTRCPRPPVARTWCNKHYVRWQRTGDPLVVRTQKAPAAACKVDDCTTAARVKGWCRKHYSRMYRRGTMDLLRRQFTYTDDLSADFMELVETEGGDADACWVWGGTVTVHGYGSWMHTPAHRYAYALHHGPFAEGLVIDHACHDPRVCPGGPSCPHRRCVNPLHLKAVTHKVNVSRERSSVRRPDDDGCSVTNCTRPYGVLNDGSPLCYAHLQRLKKHGDVFADQPIRTAVRRMKG